MVFCNAKQLDNSQDIRNSFQLFEFITQFIVYNIYFFLKILL